jgi:hypothetical protein
VSHNPSNPITYVHRLKSFIEESVIIFPPMSTPTERANASSEISCNELIRHFILACNMITSIALVLLSYDKRDVPIYAAIYSNSLPCFVVFVLNIIPEACHQSSRVNVQFLVVFVGLVVGGIMWYFEKSLGIGISMIIGSVYSAVLWIATALIWTDSSRIRQNNTLKQNIGVNKTKKFFSYLEDPKKYTNDDSENTRLMMV